MLDSHSSCLVLLLKDCSKLDSSFCMERHRIYKESLSKEINRLICMEMLRGRFCKEINMDLKSQQHLLTKEQQRYKRDD